MLDVAAMQVTTHRGGLEVIHRWADAWRNLCEQTPNDQPFYRPEWIAAHIHAFTPHAKVVLLTVISQGELLFVLPLLQEWSMFGGIPVRKLRAPVNGHSCRFDAVRHPGPQGEAAVLAAWNHLRGMGGWDVLEFEEVLAGSTVDALCRAAASDGFRAVRIPHWSSPYVAVPADPAEMTKLPVNAKLRSQLRQKRRELEAQAPGGLKLVRVEQARRDALDRFYELESSGWKGAEGSAIACAASTRQFYDEIAQAAERFGYLCLYRLELNGKSMAAHFGLAHKGRYFSPKVAYNEEMKQYAAGHLIVEEILKDCAARNLSEYDITGANDEWKMKWTAQARDKFHHYIFRPGIRGRLALAMGLRVRPEIARWVRPLRSAFSASARKFLG